MEFKIEQKLPRQSLEEKRITSPKDIYNLKEVQEIKNAVQEHLLFVGLDNKKHVTNVNILGIGSDNKVQMDVKYILRTALLNACAGAIIVHNHPSGDLKPSVHDKDFTATIDKLLEVFNIELVDHVIVSDKGYSSIKEYAEVWSNSKIDILDKTLLVLENEKLKNEISKLKENQECIEEEWE